MFKKEWVKKLFLVVFGVAIGFVNGFLGSGGGTLAVTALLTVGGLDQKRAQATALLIILPISVVSTRWEKNMPWLPHRLRSIFSGRRRRPLIRVASRCRA